MILLIDAGNTRIKWAWLDAGRLEPGGAVGHRGAAPRDWLTGLPGAPQPDRIVVANVAGPTVAHALGEWALARWSLRPEFVHSRQAAGGISSSYAHPETLGVDRFLGMIGAWQRARGPLVSIVVGTALTVDAVDAAGHHVGGLIVPGYELMTDALLHRTSEIAPGVAVAAPEATGMFGNNTAAAVDLGARHALAAVADRAVAEVRVLTGLPPRVFLGGGDAEHIAGLLATEYERAPDLVLEGLAVLARVPE